MKKKIIFPILLLLCLFLIKKSDLFSTKSTGKIPGSYKALELFSYIRAYPEKDIPDHGYAEAFDYQQKHLAKMSFLKSENEWEAMGPENTAGRTLTITANPQDENTIYAGSASGGLWRSRSLGLGDSWEYINTGFPVLGVSTIAFPEQDSSVMYIGTGEVYNYLNAGTDGAFRSTRGSYGIGILKSLDGGQTWEKSLDWSYNQKHGVWMIKVAPSNPNIVYAATTDGVYKSINAGASWDQVSAIIMGTDIDIDPRDPKKVVASFGNFGTPGKGIYYTTNGGASWSQSTGDLNHSFQGKILLARAPSNPDVVYASVGNGFGFNDGATWLLRSEDGGISWTERNNTDYSRWQGWFSHDISVHPENEDEIVCVGIDIWRSTDGGFTLNQMTTGGVAFGTPPVDGPDGPPSYSHSDHHFVAHHPDVPGLVLIGNDGGVFLSFDDGVTVRSANGGYQSTQFYNGFSVSHTDGEFALGGLQDNSTVIFRGTRAWQRDIGGDGSWSGINQLNDSIIYGSAQNLYLARSLDRGANFNVINIPFSAGESPLFISPYVVSQTEPGFIYAGGVYVYRSVDGGDNWSPTNSGGPLNGDPVFAMDVFDQNHTIVYAATLGISNRSTVFVTTSAGDSWSSSNAGLPNRVPNDIEIDPNNPSIAYICFSGFGGGHLYKTMDFGQNWELIDNGLPDVPGNAVAVDPDDSSIIYYGNDLGVYYTKNGGDSWVLMDQGLPSAIIAMDIKVSPSDRKIWVATHGNGSYRADMVEGSVSNENTDYNLVDINVYPNPTSDYITIENDDLSNDFNWEIYGMDGQLIRQGNQRQINVSDLMASQYYLRLHQKAHMITKTFVKI